MAASVAELILARAAAVLMLATSAGAQVHRARDDAFDDDELPALNLRRRDTTGDPRGDQGQIETIEFELECTAKGAGPETLADALHMQAHALLCADATMASLGMGLRCLGTSLTTETGDRPRAQLSARYRLHCFVRPGDLTRTIT